MPSSIITFESLNADPLPPPTAQFPGYGYGTVVGGDHCLDSKDAGVSYIKIFPNLGATSEVVTARAVATPPIPAGASAVFRTADDLANSHAQAALETASVDNDVRPTFVGYSSVVPLADFPGEFGFAGPFDTRAPTGPLWGTDWWDESDGGFDDGPSACFLDSDVIVRTIQAGGYFIIGGGNGPDQRINTDISYLQLQVTWVGAELRTPPDPEQFRTVGGAPFNLLIPGVGWVPWRAHGASG